jgi:catechol 2,3-dioxygenase-like lactoylglutathione lyase family enzyme
MATQPIEIQRVAHCNVNCTSLERSHAYYRDVLGLRANTHTAPVPQDGTGFGLSGQIQWDAYILGDHRGAFTGGPAVDLLEWKLPPPVGQPYPVAHQLGFARLTFAVPAGGPLAAGEQGDPDGVVLRTVAEDVPGIEFRGVTVNCSDLARSLDWYQANLGLEEVGRETTGATASATLVHGSMPSFRIELREWRDPTPVGRPYESANHVGIYRMAFIVADCHVGHDGLAANGVEGLTPPVWLDMGPEVPIDGLWAIFFPDPDGTCLELIGQTAPTGSPS